MERPQFSLELRDVVFEVKQSLSDTGFRLIGRSTGRIGGTENFGGDGHLDGL